MKAEDLMIGDWVNFHLEIFSTDYEGIETIHDEVLEIGKVSALSSIGNVWVIDSEGEEHQVTKDEIEPIPLTPEIIEKNGFNLDKEIVDCELYEGIDNRVTIHNYKVAINSKNKWRVDVDNENYSSIASCELTYVHELQHLLKLCGIDKEIVV